MIDWDDQHGQPAYADERIAARLGVTLVEFWHLAGNNWQRMDVGDDGDAADWYAAGDPVQVMLGLEHHSSQVLVSRPEGRWDNVLTYVPASPSVVEHIADMRAALDAVCKARRRTFRWCRYCRQSTPPEYRDQGDVCMSCAERVLGVIH